MKIGSHKTLPSWRIANYYFYAEARNKRLRILKMYMLELKNKYK